jgi:hypothetical protein
LFGAVVPIPPLKCCDVRHTGKGAIKAVRLLRRRPILSRARCACAGETAAEGERAMAEQEMKAAEETYSGFLSLFKVGSIITAIVTVFVVLLIAS